MPPTWPCWNAGPTRTPLVKAGRGRLTAVIAKASKGHQGPERASRVAGRRPGRRSTSTATHPAVSPSTDLAAEVATEVRLLRATQAELAVHAAERENALPLGRPRRPGPQPARPGRGRRPRPGRRSWATRPGSANGKQFRSFTGLVPKASRDRRHRPQGPAHVQGRLVAAAHHPRPRRRHRPQAGPPAGPHLLRADGRAGQGPPRRPLRRRRQPGRTGLGRDGPAACPTSSATPTAAPSPPPRPKPIIAEHWTVPADVRARRRSKKAGKAPQKVLAGQSKPRRSRRRRTGRPSPPNIVHGDPQTSQEEPLDTRSPIGNQAARTSLVVHRARVHATYKRRCASTSGSSPSARAARSPCPRFARRRAATPGPWPGARLSPDANCPLPGAELREPPAAQDVQRAPEGSPAGSLSGRPQRAVCART